MEVITGSRRLWGRQGKGCSDYTSVVHESVIKQRCARSETSGPVGPHPLLVIQNIYLRK